MLASFVGKWRLHPAQTGGFELELLADATGWLHLPHESHGFSWGFFPRRKLACIAPFGPQKKSEPVVRFLPCERGRYDLLLSWKGVLPSGGSRFTKYEDGTILAPINGKVIRLARRRWLALAVGGVFLGAGLAAFLVRFGNSADAVKAVLGLLGAIFGLVWCLYWILPRNRRLVVGRTCLQLVDGKDRIRGQVPYAQITGIYFDHFGDEESWLIRATVRLTLAGLPRADTFWPGLDEWDKDLLLDQHFLCPIPELRKLLRGHWEDDQRRREREQEVDQPIPPDTEMRG